MHEKELDIVKALIEFGTTLISFGTAIVSYRIIKATSKKKRKK